MAERFARYERLALAETCPPQRPGPRQLYLSARTWSAFRANASWKRRMFEDLVWLRSLGCVFVLEGGSSQPSWQPIFCFVAVGFVGRPLAEVAVRHAFDAFVVKCSQAFIRQAAKEDRARCLDQRLHTVALQLGQGRSESTWSLAWELSGKRSTLRS